MASDARQAVNSGTWSAGDARQPGWFWSSNAIFDLPVSGCAKLTYLYLCRRGRNGDRESFQSLDVMAAAVGAAKRTVVKALRELASLGAIKVQPGGGRGYCSRYVVCEPPSQESVQTSPRLEEPASESVQTSPRFDGQNVLPRALVGKALRKEEALKQEEAFALTRESRTKEKAPIHQAIDCYHELFVKLCGKKPDLAAKDLKRLKDLVTRHSLQTVLGHLTKFFASTDAWVRNSGYTIAAFASQFNKLTVAESQGEHYRNGHFYHPGIDLGVKLPPDPRAEEAYERLRVARLATRVVRS